MNTNAFPTGRTVLMTVHPSDDPTHNCGKIPVGKPITFTEYLIEGKIAYLASETLMGRELWLTKLTSETWTFRCLPSYGVTLRTGNRVVCTRSLFITCDRDGIIGRIVRSWKSSNYFSELTSSEIMTCGHGHFRGSFTFSS